MSGDDEAMVYRDQLATLIRDTVMNGEGRVECGYTASGSEHQLSIHPTG